jgi:hypothetical protein
MVERQRGGKRAIPREEELELLRKLRGVPARAASALKER